MSNKPKFEDAPEVADLLPAMMEKIAEHADNLPAGELPKIKCLFALGENLSYWGQIRLTAGPWRYLNDFDYVLIINACKWADQNILEHEALIFHELLHIGYKENNKGEVAWKIRRHMIETFPEEVRVYGPWRSDLDELKGAYVSHGLAHPDIH